MRIDDRNALAGGAADRAAADRADSVASSQSIASGKGTASHQSRLGGDSVQISGSSLLLRNFDTARSARIEQLAKSIQAGSYSVNPALISRALVGETLARQPE